MAELTEAQMQEIVDEVTYEVMEVVARVLANWMHQDDARQVAADVERRLAAGRAALREEG